MPRRFFKRKSRKRKSRRRRTKPDVLVRTKLLAKLTYVDTITMNPGVSAIASHTFRANSLFDPDLTGTGHQPLGRDEYALRYNHYRVVSSTIKVTAIASGVTDSNPALWGVMNSPDTTLGYSGATAGTAIIENPRIKGGWKINGHSDGFSPNAIPSSITVRFNSKQLGPEGKLRTTTMDANPSVGGIADAYFHLWAASFLSNDPGAQDFLVQLTQIVEFTDPIVLAQS